MWDINAFRLSVFGFYNLGQWATNTAVNSQNGSDFVMIEQCKLCYNVTENNSENAEENEVEFKKPPSEGQLHTKSKIPFRKL